MNTNLDAHDMLRRLQNSVLATYYSRCYPMTNMNRFTVSPWSSPPVSFLRGPKPWIGSSEMQNAYGNESHRFDFQLMLKKTWMILLPSGTNICILYIYNRNLQQQILTICNSPKHLPHQPSLSLSISTVASDAVVSVSEQRVIWKQLFSKKKKNKTYDTSEVRLFLLAEFQSCKALAELSSLSHIIYIYIVPFTSILYIPGGAGFQSSSISYYWF